MTLIEVVIALPIVVMAAGFFASMVATGARQQALHVETALASGVARDVLERIRNEDLVMVFPLYNVDLFDDPNGPGTAPGHLFDVPGLEPWEGDEAVGEIFLPGADVGTPMAPDWQLREDVVNPDLGLPRDLNGDSIVDDKDHEADVSLLPIHVRVRWQGPYGRRELHLHTSLTEIGT